MGRNHRFSYPPFFYFFAVSLRHFADPCRLLFTEPSVYFPFSFLRMSNIFCCSLSLLYPYYSTKFSFVKGFLKNFLKNFKFFCKLSLQAVGILVLATTIKCGVRNAECRMQNAECGMRDAECGVRSAECRIQNLELLLILYA